MIVIGTLLIFVLTYMGILHKNVHKTVATMSGAVAMVLFGQAMGFYSADLAIDYIDFNTIGLILGLMIIHGLLGETGAMEYLAIKTAKLSNGSYYRLLALMVLVTAFASAFLDNVTTILMVVPITVIIAKELEINPVPFIIVEMIAANIGGVSTLIGDPPNIMIASAADIRFIDYLIYLAPIVVIILFVVILVFELLFKDMLERDMENFQKVMALDESNCITNYPLLYKSLFVLLLTVALFMVHHIIGIEPWIVALLGASLLLLLSLSEPEEALLYVNWSTLIFFAGLFVLIGGLIEAGIIESGAARILDISQGDLLFSLFLVLMLSGAFAMAVGNIPAVITFIPAVNMIILESNMENGFLLWFALALGVGFGGNATLISSPSNLLVANISEKMGYPISFKRYLKIGLPVTMFCLLLSFLLLYVFYLVLL